MSCFFPGVKPVKSGSVTPTIVNGTAFNEMTRPMADRSPPNAPLPKGVAQDDNRRSGKSIIAWDQRAPHNALHTQRGEIIPGYKLAACHAGRPVTTEHEASGPGERRCTGKHFFVRPNQLEEGIRKRAAGWVLIVAFPKRTITIRVGGIVREATCVPSSASPRTLRGRAPASAEALRHQSG